MRGLLFVVASFAVTILAWGLYGPMLHAGQAGMADGAEAARLRPFVCVGISYFAIGVIVPIVLLYTKGEPGGWTIKGITRSFLAGVLGAVGALGIVMAFTYGGRPSYVMPLVFGGAPVVNSFLTIYWAKKGREIGPLFLAGLMMVLIGATLVLVCKPGPPKHADDHVATALASEGANEDAREEANEEVQAAQPAEETAAAVQADSAGEAPSFFGLDWLKQLASIATVILCWGAYGPVLHQGQAAMQQSRLRPLLCVGLAYFAVAVVVPNLLLSGPMTEASSYTFSGTTWSLAAGAAGAIGALGIILAFAFGGKPVYVMPLVFGGAPVVNTIATVAGNNQFEQMSTFGLACFLAGLILVIAGAAMVLVFAPKGAPAKKSKVKEAEKPKSSEQPSDAALPADKNEPNQ